MGITKKHKNVVEEILKKVVPSRAEILEVKAVQKEILSKLKLKDSKAVLGGSGAKNTWLGGTHDIDVYVKFNYSKYKYKSEKISEVLCKYLKKKFSKVVRLHGSRDYFQVNINGYTVEIVPILNIKNSKQAENITDFSQFHVDYVNKGCKKKKGLNNEIRLAKVFAKANRFYGAESHIKGLSGYALELLVIHYGGFLKLINATGGWKKTTLVGNKKDEEKLNWAKKISPLRIIDPVQPDRNAGAAVSEEKYEDFVKICKKFMSKPSLDFFEKKDIDVAKLRRKGCLLIVEAEPLSKKKDVAGAKALKAFEFVVANLKDFDFVDAVFDYEDSVSTFYFVVKKERLSEDYKQFGPPVKNKDAVKNFKSAHKGSRFGLDKKSGKCYVVVKRSEEDREILSFIKNVLKHDAVCSRIKNIILI
tara:strand:+ start:469 stop:1722 length:1254 start_codon:yes stop_codon:yes gene_type:complete